MVMPGIFSGHLYTSDKPCVKSEYPPSKKVRGAIQLDNIHMYFTLTIDSKVIATGNSNRLLSSTLQRQSLYNTCSSLSKKGSQDRVTNPKPDAKYF